MALSTKLFASLLLALVAALAVLACDNQCKGCNAFDAYWSGQGCGEGSNQVFDTVTLPTGSDHTACCSVCLANRCCIFWVYAPANQTCTGYSNCVRIDGQPTVREWLGDWKNFPEDCPGYTPGPIDAEIGFPGFYNPADAPWPIGNNPTVKGS